MRLQSSYVTSDGLHHNTEDDARQHAERRYADALTSIARAMTVLNFSGHCDYIDANAKRFAELATLKADTLPPSTDNDDA